MSALSAELEAALVRELARAWHGINAVSFKGALKSPVIGVSDTVSRLGAWHRGARSITLARSLILDHPWGVVLEVLKHEMAHQYAHEVLGAIDETAHGPAFQSVCARLGIDPGSQGLPVSPDGEGPEARLIRRIARLLALAESSNANEASAAMNAARRLMLQHNIAAVGAHTYGFRHLGRPSARLQESERLLASILAGHFFVQAIWVPTYDPRAGRSGRVLEICGAAENLDLAAYVYGFLEDTAWRLWKEHKRATGNSGERERQRFTSGVMRGFMEKLAEGAAVNRSEGLVWVGDPRLEDFLHGRHPRLRNVRYGGGRRTPTHEEGRDAGRKIVLHRPISEQAGARGKLLGGA